MKKLYKLTLLYTTKKTWKATDVFSALTKKLRKDGNIGGIKFKLSKIEIDVEQNNIIGNLIEEWIGKWLNKEGVYCVPNQEQSSPDIWLNPNSDEDDWLEVKAFYDSPSFDVAAWGSFVALTTEKPWKLNADYLLIKYNIEGSVITIEKIWLKKIWEICCSSKDIPLKVQKKRDEIFNIRPATWYSDKNLKFPTFEKLEDFLAAVYQTIYNYKPMGPVVARKWKKELIESYKNKYGKVLDIPLWSSIEKKYRIYDTKK